MSQTPQRRPYVSRTASFASGADSPVQVLEECMIETADMVTGMGSPLFDGYRPRFDAASVQGLRESGAVILGKTVTTEFASSQPRGTRNPWDLTRTPGGSSSG